MLEPQPVQHAVGDRKQEAGNRRCTVLVVNGMQRPVQCAVGSGKWATSGDGQQMWQLGVTANGGRMMAGGWWLGCQWSE
jgi:hypothetical protein